MPAEFVEATDSRNTHFISQEDGNYGVKKNLFFWPVVTNTRRKWCCIHDECNITLHFDVLILVQRNINHFACFSSDYKTVGNLICRLHFASFCCNNKLLRVILRFNCSEIWCSISSINLLTFVCLKIAKQSKELRLYCLELN